MFNKAIATISNLIAPKRSAPKRTATVNVKVFTPIADQNSAYGLAAEATTEPKPKVLKRPVSKHVNQRQTSLFDLNFDVIGYSVSLRRVKGDEDRYQLTTNLKLRNNKYQITRTLFYNKKDAEKARRHVDKIMKFLFNKAKPVKTQKGESLAGK